ncbi:MAG: hypothetical protein CVV27_09290 [Candidatus Melainabacteria bacterium HGW-Melainabacteria-1]|nr:MAG: hypothetical protein CVV27_09290 [Candidatus Melainabacteria bacterium HGW-Melainabacteria-1]
MKHVLPHPVRKRPLGIVALSIASWLLLTGPGLAQNSTWTQAPPARLQMALIPDGVLSPYWEAWLQAPSVPSKTDTADKQADPTISPAPVEAPPHPAADKPVTIKTTPEPIPSLSPKAWIYISKKAQRLYLKDGELTLAHWPVSTARYSVSTPEGRFRVINLVENPSYSGRHGYYPPKHPKNPLGTRWLGLNVGHFRTGVPIGIHGTIEPDKIGQAVSDGCIRLRNQDVETLSKVIRIGLPVVISKL